MSDQERVLTLQCITTAGPQLSMRYSYNGYQFSQALWYDFDLNALDKIYGEEFMEMVFFNVAAFSTFQLCSYRLDVIDWGPYARWHTAEFERVWKTALHKLSGQWRYENGLTQWKPPRFVSTSVSSVETRPATIQPDVRMPNTLALFGGGKDSTVMLELLRKASISFSSLTYSHTIYGCSALQHERSPPLLHLLPSSPIQGSQHRLSIFEDYLNAPTLGSLGKEVGISSFLDGETSLALFAAVPIALFYCYTSILFGNERSANVGNLVWEEVSGEEINHQWGKSKEHELLLGRYIQDTLVSNLSHVSVLMPIHDVVIFNVAKTRLDAVFYTHSCNMLLSWCKRCPKCCYVWLSFMAYLPCSLVNKMFAGDNLFDAAENDIHFTQMMGLGSRKPFDCVGEIDEARLAFELCHRKGLQGRAMDIYVERVQPTLSEPDLARIVNKYTAVYTEDSSHIPGEIWSHLLPVLKQAGEDARKDVKAALAK